MSREYKCIRIVYGCWSEDGTQALCKMAEEVNNHATAITGAFVPQGHRLLTSPVIKVQVTAEEIAVFTMSGSKYWMSNSEKETPCVLTEKDRIKEWLFSRGKDPDPWLKLEFK